MLLSKNLLQNPKWKNNWKYHFLFFKNAPDVEGTELIAGRSHNRQSGLRWCRYWGRFKSWTNSTISIHWIELLFFCRTVEWNLGYSKRRIKLNKKQVPCSKYFLKEYDIKRHSLLYGLPTRIWLVWSKMVWKDERRIKTIMEYLDPDISKRPSPLFGPQLAPQWTLPLWHVKALCSSQQ